MEKIDRKEDLRHGQLLLKKNHCLRIIDRTCLNFKMLNLSLLKLECWAYIFGEVRLGVYSTKTKEGILEIVQGCREQEPETT